MSEKLIIDWNEYNRSIDELAVQISESGFKPSFIICIARGGLRVGDILSRIFKVKCGYLGVESYSSAGEGKVSDVQNELTFARDLSTTSKVYGENILVEESEPLKNECMHFIDVVRNASKPLTDGEEGLRVLNILSAATESKNTNKKIKVKI